MPASRARCRANDPTPNAGRNSAGERDASSTVPTSSRSATATTPADDAATARAASSSCDRRAGRSPASSATPVPGYRAAATSMPYRKAALSPSPGTSATTTAPRSDAAAAIRSSSVITRTATTWSARNVASTVSSSIARASSGRRLPAASASLDLAVASGLAGTTTTQPTSSGLDVFTGADATCRTDSTLPRLARDTDGATPSAGVTGRRQESSGCDQASTFRGFACAR